MSVHPFSGVFLLHVALEVPLAIQGLFGGVGLPFIEMTNTTLVLLKLYGALSLGTCVAALLCRGLPDHLPGKRALVINLVIYHLISSTVLIQTPRFIPISFGAIMESIKLTPEVVWGSMHGFIALFFVTWWQATLPSLAAARK